MLMFCEVWVEDQESKENDFKIWENFFNLNSVLESLKEQCAYLIDDKICISSILGENFKIVEDDTCLILKVQLKTWKSD